MLSLTGNRTDAAPTIRTSTSEIQLEDLVALGLKLDARLEPGVPVAMSSTKRSTLIVGLCAAVQGCRRMLLPSDRAPISLQRLADEYPNLRVIVDADVGLDRHTPARNASSRSSSPGRIRLHTPNDDQVILIAYTSGTTGRPVPNPRSWRTLCVQEELCSSYLDLRVQERYSFVATVPPTHMYGLEFSVLVPLHFGGVIHDETPLLPPEIARCLSSVSPPRILVTTPIHLRALLRSKQRLPSLELVVCATSPLTVALAEAFEQRYDTSILEIYGCTESGAIAARHPVRDSLWRLGKGIDIHVDNGRPHVEAAHIQGPVEILDIIELESKRRFRLLGRSDDLIKVAGKRASLSGLGALLLEIDGVDDGAFYLPEEDASGGVQRLVLFVVAPQMSDDALRSALRVRLDPAFVPRRIVRVDKLPREGSGKLPLDALRILAHRQNGH